MRILPALALALLMAGCAQPASTPQSQAAPTTGYAAQQQIAIAEHPSLGNWTLDCGLGAAEFARNATAKWLQPCVARTSHTPGSKEEMWISVNPKDPSNVVVGAKDLNPANSLQCVWNGLGVTKDGGKTWTDVVIGGTFASRTPTSPFFGYRCNTDPDFRFDSKGDLHYGVEMYDVGAGVLPENVVTQVDSGYKILLATSHDGGLTWPDVITYQPDFGFVTDFSRMARSPKTDTILEAIGSEEGAGCNVLRWTATTAQVATFEPVATKEGFPCNSGGGAGIAAAPDGTFVLVGAAGIVARSTDDGLTFPPTDTNPLFTWKGIPGKFSESKYRVTNTVESAYDVAGPHKGTLYVTYAAADRDGDEADIYVRSSTDNGKTWSEASRVNPDAAGTHQWMPNIGVAADGSVHVAYMDKSYDTLHNHTFIDISHGVSFDGGKTWQTERVTSTPFDGDLGLHQNGFAFIGDYLGVDCAGMDCWFGFPDSSLGGVPVIAAAHTHMGMASQAAKPAP